MDAGVRDALRALPEPRFFSIQSRRLRRGALRKADGLLRHGREGPGGIGIPLGAPYDWDQASVAELGLAAIDPLLDAHSWSGKAEHIVPAAAVIMDWIGRGGDAEGADKPGVVGQRAYRLGYAVRAAASCGEIDDEQIGELVEAALRDGRVLGGLQKTGPVAAAAGLLSLTGYLGVALPELSALQPLALDRALEVFGGEFGPDGVHVSRSPARHAAMTAVLGSVMDAGVVESPDLDDLRMRAEDALAWLTMPDGRLAGFGSTGDVLVSPVWGSRGTVPHLLEDRYRSRTLLYAATAGALGLPGVNSTRVFPDAGFAVSRSHWPSSTQDRESGYLALTSARRVDIGHQADTLSFVWFDGGMLLLSDAGQVVSSVAPQPAEADAPAGPVSEGDAPESGIAAPDEEGGRTYVRSTRAHNTVEVDGSDQEPGEAPAAPAVARWGEISGVRFIDAEIEFASASHRRSLVWSPGAWLLVVDRLRGDVARRYRQWFHAADHLDVIQRGDGFVMASEGEPVAWATEIAGDAAPMTAVRGRSGTYPQGWWSPGSAGLIPAWAYGWEAEGRERIVATVCSLGGRVVPVRLSSPQLGWKAGGRTVVVTMSDAGIGDIETGRDEEVA